MNIEKIPSEQALRYLAYNPDYAIVMFGRLPQTALHNLKSKISDSSQRPPSRSEGYLAPAMDFQSLSPLIADALKRITSQKKGIRLGRLFSKLTEEEASSLLRSVERAVPISKAKALADAEKTLKRRRDAFLNRPTALPDNTTYSGITGKQSSKYQPKRKAKKKYCIGSGDSAMYWAGRGKMPQCFKDAIDEGASLEDFLIPDSAVNTCE